MTTMAIRERYSRWAIAAAVVAGLAIANYLIIGKCGIDVVLNSAIELNWRLGVPLTILKIAYLGVMLSFILGAPICLLLGKLALLDIRRHPELRGRFLAELAVITAWSWILVLVTIGTGMCIELYLAMGT